MPRKDLNQPLLITVLYLVNILDTMDEGIWRCIAPGAPAAERTAAWGALQSRVGESSGASCVMIMGYLGNPMYLYYLLIP